MKRFGLPRGLSFTEVMIAVIFLAVAFLAWFRVSTSANRQSMDAYYEFLATQLAGEPIEVFRSFDFPWLEKFRLGQIEFPEYPLEETDVKDKDPLSPIQHPGESGLFRREISMTPVTQGTQKGMRVRVRVFPRGEGKLKAWWSRREIMMETLLWDLPR